MESSTLSSGHFGHGGFAKTWKKNPVSNKKPGNMRYPKSRIPRFLVKYLRICKVIVTKDEDVKVSYKKTYKKTYE